MTEQAIGSSWTRTAVVILTAVLAAFIALACNGGAPDNPTPDPSRSASPER